MIYIHALAVLALAYINIKQAASIKAQNEQLQQLALYVCDLEKQLIETLDKEPR